METMSLSSKASPACSTAPATSAGFMQSRMFGAEAAASSFEVTTLTDVSSFNFPSKAGSGQAAIISEGPHTPPRSIPWMIAEAILPAPKNAYFMAANVAPDAATRER
jgi:hypothetical protein